MLELSTRPRDRAAVLCAALLFSTGGAAIKASSMSAFQTASFRSGLAAVVLILFIPSARRGWRLSTVAVGIAYAATLVLFVVSNTMTTAANTVILQGTAPLYVLLLGPFLLGERVRARDIVFLAMLGTGGYLILTSSTPAVVTAPRPDLGNLLAAATGLTFALTIMGLRQLGRHHASNRAPAAVAVGNLIAFAVCLPFALPVEGAGRADWLAVTYLGVVQVGVAYVFLTYGMRRVSAFDSSLLLLVEPVLNPVWAYLMHHEIPTGATVVGGCLILGATAMKTIVDHRGDRNRRHSSER